MNEDYTKTALAGDGLLMEKGEGLTWAEKFSMVEKELIEDPARTDGLISSLLGKVSKSSVYRIREVLVKDGKIRDVPVPERQAANGGLAKYNKSGQHWNGNGNRIRVEEGKTVADLCREGMAAEEAGMSAEDTARIVGIGVASYREAKSIILLSDRTDLTEIEAAMVRTSLNEMNEMKRTSAAYRRVKALADRLFGYKVRRTKAKTELVIERRNEKFQNTMAVLVEMCLSASGITIPNLSNDEVAHAVRQIEEARRGIKALKERIQQRR